ncbi:MAG: hypothetical protein QGG01_08525, partial [Roseibacillus sp.]|nr:hypothetical protein [Roseibacillus sp.]
MLAFGWAFHDETPLVGHMSITNQLLSDTYPPRFVSFPAFELRYHYGFNLVSATWSALSTLPAAWGIDLATVGLGALTWGLLWSLGERVIGTGKGLWAALLGLFSAGLAMGVAPENAPLAHELLGHAVLDGAMLNPPTISYFFQHPWTLGIPLALAAMVLLTEEELTWKGAAFVGLLLLALSFSQVVLFVCLLPTAVAVAALQHGRFDKDQALKMGSIALVVVAVATQLGGLFTPRADPLESEFAFRLGVTGSFGTTLEWHLHSFGLPLLLGVAGVA